MSAGGGQLQVPGRLGAVGGPVADEGVSREIDHFAPQGVHRIQTGPEGPRQRLRQLLHALLAIPTGPDQSGGEAGIPGDVGHHHGALESALAFALLAETVRESDGQVGGRRYPVQHGLSISARQGKTWAGRSI